MTGISSILIVGIIGIVGQVIDGSLGMGFGVFSSSLLIGTGLAPAVAVTVVNTAKIFTGLSSGLSHWKFGNVRRDWLLPLVLSGIAGGVLGAYLLTSIPPEVARPWVSGLLLIAGGLLIWRSLRWRVPCAVRAWDKKCLGCPAQRRDWQWLTVQAKHHALNKIGALGFVAALVNGLSGAYGPIATSGMMFIEKDQPRYAVGTANMAEVFVAAAVVTTILFRQGPGEFPVALVLALVVGAALAAPLAAYICRSLPPRALTFSIGALLIASNVGTVSSVLL
ncbi:MAG: sulfite exporter TauE/SafE family protein [Dehalococcoidales bacterium]|nr:sulfite exporter TauE/SafE family protein [Dehalococcoidales bacterium]